MDNSAQIQECFYKLLVAFDKLNNTLEESLEISKQIRDSWDGSIDMQKRVIEIQEDSLRIAIANDLSSQSSAKIYDILIKDDVSPHDKIKELYKIFNIQK